jgi:hypothetical protein
MRSSPFRGPLFVVGMSWSGTKLLRDLLNQHPQIGIPPSESRFLPAVIERFGSIPDLLSVDRMACIASWALASSFEP